MTLLLRSRYDGIVQLYLKDGFFVYVIRTSFTGASTYPIYNSNTNTEVPCVTNKTGYTIQLLTHYLNYLHCLPYDAIINK